MSALYSYMEKCVDRTRRRVSLSLLIKGILFGLMMTSLLQCATETTGVNSRAYKRERQKMYNEALAQLVSDKYFEKCIIPDDTLKKRFGEFIEGKIDSAAYARVIAKYKEARKDRSPACVVEYTGNRSVFQMKNSSDSIVNASIDRILQDSSFAEYATPAMREALSDTAILVADDFSLEFLQPVEYVKDPENPFGKGIGVFGFSDAWINPDMNKAVVYYMYRCGTQCGTGELLFLEKRNEVWKIVRYETVWKS